LFKPALPIQVELPLMGASGQFRLTAAIQCKVAAASRYSRVLVANGTKSSGAGQDDLT
jgi:hypothetical protein